LSLLPLVATLALLTPVLADPLALDDEVSEFDRSGTQRLESIETGDTVVVVNPFGNVYARFGGYENQVEILATTQRLETELPELKVGAEQVEGGLDIVVGPARPTVGGAAGAAPAADSEGFETRDRVDLVVFVPQGATLDVRTEDDLIEVKGLKGDVIASSVKGDVRIRSIEGRVRAKTARGQISAMLESDATKQSQELTTETGDIEVHIWEDANFHVRIATSGEISTDFSLTVEHRRFEEPGKIAEAIVGLSGPDLRLSSKRGRVRLLRLQRQDKPYKSNQSDG
jgi:hypothetical protein